MRKGTVDFKKLFQAIPEPVLVVSDEDFRFLEVNRAALERFGYSRAELLEMPLADFFAPTDAARLREAMTARDLAGLGFRGWATRQKNGTAVDVNLIAAALEFGETRAFVMVLPDAAPHKSLEEQLRQAQKMEAVGMLAGGIAHDFNNLLTIISGYSQMLLAGLPADDRERSAVEQIIKASERAADLTRQLLAFSRRQTIQPKVLDLNSIVAGMSSMLHRLIGEHIDLRIEPGSELGTIHADLGQIDQVILNLAVNSRDAMPGGGSLIIETRNVELGEQYTSSHLAVKPGKYVMLAMSDNGAGMDPAVKAKVFEPFFTTKGEGKGTGLGLSTVYGIVKQSGGSIDLYSEPGRGTSVKVYFPRVDEAVPFEASREIQEAAGGWETILIVEDDEAVRRLVKSALERRGYSLLVAADGASALKIIKKHQGFIHLLITDMVMPHMNGRELALRLRKTRPEIEVLYISGYTGAALQQAGDLEMETPFLQKPFAPIELARKVREILDASSTAQKAHDGAGS